jgi:hypothetical protein
MIQMLMARHEVNDPYAVPEARKRRMNQRPGSHAEINVVLRSGVFGFWKKGREIWTNTILNIIWI